MTPLLAEGEKHRNHSRMAYRLAASHSDQLMFVHGLGWFHWDDRRWIEDQRGIATQSVLEMLRSTWDVAFNDKDLQVDVQRCQSAAGVRGVLDIASNLPQFAYTVRDLDTDPHLLNTANGTLDLRTFELRAHDPADRITKVTTAAYRPEATSAPWAEFLATVLPDDEVRGFLHRLIGVGLLGVVLDHILAIFTGSGRNGKGTFYKAVLFALNDYAGPAEPDLFMQRTGAHPTGEMDLLGKRIIVVSESDKDRQLAEATMKRLTGNDTIKARRMRQDFVEFKPSHTPILVTNHLPKVSGDDEAIWRRLRVIPFEVVIDEADQDKHLDDKLNLDADAILTWAVAGYREYKQVGLDEPPKVLAATEAYRLSSDAISQFVQDRCTTGAGNLQTVAHVGVRELFTAWTAWCSATDNRPGGERDFRSRIEKQGFGVIRMTAGMRYQGIGLAVEGDQEEERPNELRWDQQ